MAIIETGGFEASKGQEEFLLRTLKKINTWWETQNISKELVPETRRDLFDEVIKFLDDSRIISIIGPRRTGKTTLMRQIIDQLIRSKTPPKNILFFSGDDVELKQVNNFLGQSVSVYFEEYLKQNYIGDAKVYIFIDEIHKISDWQLWLKKFYDLKYNIKFIISGSSAAKIKKGQKESLVGRIIEFTLFPLSFSEFLRFSKVKTSIHPSNLSDFNESTVRKLEEITSNEITEARKSFDNYAVIGGFPEWFETHDVQRWQIKLREDITKRIIYDDITTLYGIKNPAELESVFVLLSALQSSMYSYNSIANTLNIDNETAKKYVNYLKESFLIFEAQNYSASIEKQIRKNYKYIAVDNGIKNAFERITDLHDINERDLGFVIEGMIQQHFSRISERNSYEMFYWHENGMEVDIVLKTNKKILPIEVKYRSSINESDISSLIYFMKKFKLKQGIVASKNEIKVKEFEGKKIFFIPCWMLLLLFNF